MSITTAIVARVITAPNPQPGAGGIWGWVNLQMMSGEQALIAASWIVAIVIVLGTAGKTKALVPTAIAAVVGALLIFLCSGGMKSFSGKVGETVDSAPAIVQEHHSTQQDPLDERV